MNAKAKWKELKFNINAEIDFLKGNVDISKGFDPYRSLFNEKIETLKQILNQMDVIDRI